MKKRYLITRSATRVILSRYLNQAPSQIKLRVTDSGKPWHPEIFFNLTHSQNTGLIAVSQNNPVGIDLEHIRPVKNMLLIAKRLFTPSEYECLRVASSLRGAPATRQSSSHLDCAAKLAMTTEQERVFFNIWTAKEALIKAKGLSLAKHAPKETAWPKPEDSRCSLVALKLAENQSAHVAFQNSLSNLETVHVSDFSFGNII